MTSGENTTKSDDWESLIATKMPSQGGGVQMSHKLVSLYIGDGEYYTRTDADNVIAEKDAEIAELKSRIAPKQSDKSLQERLNEVCEKHGVSTLQDLDWAFCESEKRHTNDRIESAKVFAELQNQVHDYAQGLYVIQARAEKELRRQKHKRCLANAEACMHKRWRPDEGFDFARSTRHMNKWLELSEKFKLNN